MAVVTYVCDTCRREIELPQVKHGLEVMSGCIITNNCKGKLSLKQVNTSQIYSKITDVSLHGLEDWVKRKFYFKFHQSLSSKFWKIKHNLDTFPLVQVFVFLSDGSLQQTENFQINFKNLFEIEIVFDSPYSGFVECFSYSSAKKLLEKQQTQNRLTLTTQQEFFINPNGVLTFAIPINKTYDNLFINFVSSTTGLTTSCPFQFMQTVSFLSPWWKQTEHNNPIFVYFFNKKFRIVTVRIDEIILDSLAKDVSSFYFSTSSNQHLLNEIYILLSNSPHTFYDRVQNYVINMAVISQDAAIQQKTKQTNKKLFVSSQIVQPLFPLIMDC